MIKLTNDSQAHDTGPAEAKLNWSGRVRDCVRKQAELTACVSTQQLGGYFGGMPPRENFMLCMRSLLRPFYARSQFCLLGRLDSDPIWHVHMRQICGLVAYWFEHCV